MNKVKYFRNHLKELHKKLNIKANIELKQDNRLGKYVAHVQPYDCPCCKDNFFRFRYNTKKIKNASKIEILMVILHELGHIIYQHYKIKDRLKKEYEAEKYAVLQIKKYYPSYYKKAIKSIKDYTNHSDKIYRIAFTKLYKELANE